jgi:hypothetical protein
MIGAVEGHRVRGPGETDNCANRLKFLYILSICGDDEREETKREDDKKSAHYS